MITWSPGTGIKQKSRVLILRTDENPKGVSTLDMMSVVESVAQSEETSSVSRNSKEKNNCRLTTYCFDPPTAATYTHLLTNSRSQGKRNTSPNNKNGHPTA